MPTFPASLPALSTVGQTEATLPDYTRRTQMDAGPAKVRRITTAAPRPMTVGHPGYTTAEMQSLVTFFEDTLAGGSLAFDMADPVSGTTRSFRFVSPPQLSAVTWDHWSVVCQVEVLP